MTTPSENMSARVWEVIATGYPSPFAWGLTNEQAREVLDARPDMPLEMRRHARIALRSDEVLAVELASGYAYAIRGIEFRLKEPSDDVNGNVREWEVIAANHPDHPFDWGLTNKQAREIIDSHRDMPLEMRRHARIALRSDEVLVIDQANGGTVAITGRGDLMQGHDDISEEHLRGTVADALERYKTEALELIDGDESDKVVADARERYDAAALERYEARRRGDDAR